MEKWICIVCDYVYDPELGDRDSGIPPGTNFEDLPEDWACPLCGARKSDFVRLSDVTEESTKIDEKETYQNKLVWSDEYSINIKAMDEQHKKLVAIINKHNIAVNSKKQKEILKNTLKGLLEYIEIHFEKEQELMMLHGFPEYKAHKEEHDYINQEVYDLYMKYKKGDESTAFMLGSLMKDWLFNHICKEDKKYGKYLNSKGVT